MRSALSQITNNLITLTLHLTLAKMKVSIRNSGLHFMSLRQTPKAEERECVLNRR